MLELGKLGSNRLRQLRILIQVGAHGLVQGFAGPALRMKFNMMWFASTYP